MGSPSQVTFCMRDRITGDVREHVVDLYPWEDDESIQFYYRDGNFGCDCNRVALFYKDIPSSAWPDDVSDDCNPRGTPNRFVIDSVIAEDGHLIYSDSGEHYG